MITSKILSNLPTTPGVYIYRNQAGEIIYVGKAINLKKRVNQYFQRDDALGPKTASLVSQIFSIETKTVDSEIQALILEASLIKKHKPKFNSLLKDDRSYVYICISKEAIPRVFTARFSELNKQDIIYGPFPNGSAVNSLLKTLRYIFPYRRFLNHPKTECLYCHLGMCPGPNPDPLTYRQNISKIKKILSGKIKSVQRLLEKEMKEASLKQEYETALTRRYQLQSINYVVNGWSALHNFYSKVELPEDLQSSAIQELMTTLNPYFHFSKIDRIECFDISQMGDRYFVGSMTVYKDGHIDKSEYRKFKINNVIASLSMSKAQQSNSDLEMSANDSYMIKEVVWRRLKHPEWGTPDLILVDGGKPQVSAAVSAIKASSLRGVLDNEAILSRSSFFTPNDIPIIGLAKKFETIVLKLDEDWVEINLPNNSHALHLLQTLRNEAHRFANHYRKELMKRLTLPNNS